MHSKVKRVKLFHIIYAYKNNNCTDHKAWQEMYRSERFGLWNDVTCVAWYIVMKHIADANAISPDREKKKKKRLVLLQCPPVDFNVYWQFSLGAFL